MRILHLSNLIGSGGVEAYVKNVTLHQRMCGHDVCVVVCFCETVDAEDNVQLLRSAGADVCFLSGDHGHDFKLFFRLRQKLRSFQPDIIHLSSLPILVAPALFFIKVPIVITLHLMGDQSLQSRIVSYAYSYVVRGVIAVSDAVELRHRDDYGAYPKACWTRIYNGISLDCFKPKRVGLEFAEDGNILLTMTCRMEPDKHPDDAIRVIAILSKCMPERQVRLQLIGIGKMDSDLRALADLLGVGDLVEFLGYQSDVTPYLQRSHGHLVLSDRETFSISALEAMACGVPIFSYSVEGGFHELHQHGVAGIVSIKRSPESLADALMGVFYNERGWSEYRGRSLERAKGFSLKKMCLQTCLFYEELLEK